MAPLSYAGRYRKGRTFENDVSDHLETNGWSSVRAAGSKGNTKADLISFHPLGVILLIQCKTNGIISAEEWDRLYEIALWNPFTRAILAYKPKPGKIVYDKLTGPRVRMKPMMNRIPYDPGKASRIAAEGKSPVANLDSLAS